jgi:hypothetical protein
MYEASGDTTVLTPLSGGFERVATSVEDRRLDNATHEVYLKTYMLRKVTTTTTIVTTLFNHHYNLPYTAFRPDLPGNYAITLTVNDGCTSASVQSTITATCGVPSIPDLIVTDRLGLATTAFVLSGTSFQRVTIDARSTAPANPRDTLTYDWRLIAPPGSEAATKLTNSNGNVASVIPDVAGTYIVSLTVDDNCSPARSRNATFVVTCSSAEMRFQTADIRVGRCTGPATTDCNSATSTAVMVPEIKFEDAKVSPDSAKYGNQFFTIIGKSGSNCAVRSRRWYADKRECATPYDIAVAPPVVTAPQTCATVRSCAWKVNKFPCGWNANPALPDRPPFAKPTTTLLNGQPSELNEGDEICTSDSTTKQCVGTDKCSTKFTCKSPGTYELSLTVNDGCSVATENTTVTCKCQNVLRADAGASQTSFYRCKSDNTGYEFAPVALEGQYSVSSVRGDGYLAQACPAPAATAAPAAPATGSCCPAATPCSACPMCVSCPICTQTAYTPGGGSAPAAGGTAFAARRKAPKAFASREEKTSDESVSLLLSVAVPVAIMTVISLAANVFLFKIYKSEEDQ